MALTALALFSAKAKAEAELKFYRPNPGTDQC
jgi:hypothetical protein